MFFKKKLVLEQFTLGVGAQPTLSLYRYWTLPPDFVGRRCWWDELCRNIYQNVSPSYHQNEQDRRKIEGLHLSNNLGSLYFSNRSKHFSFVEQIFELSRTHLFSLWCSPKTGPWVNSWRWLVNHLVSKRSGLSLPLGTIQRWVSTSESMKLCIRAWNCCILVFTSCRRIVIPSLGDFTQPIIQHRLKRPTTSPQTTLSLWLRVEIPAKTLEVCHRFPCRNRCT